MAEFDEQDTTPTESVSDKSEKSNKSDHSAHDISGIAHGENRVSFRELMGDHLANPSEVERRSDAGIERIHERFAIEQESPLSSASRHREDASSNASASDQSRPTGRWYGGLSGSAGLMGAMGLGVGGTFGGGLDVFDTGAVSLSVGGFVPIAGAGFYASLPGPGVTLGYSFGSEGSSADCYKQVQFLLPIVSVSLTLNRQTGSVQQLSVSASESIGLGVIGGVFCGASVDFKELPSELTQKAIKEFGSDPMMEVLNRLYQGF